VTLILLCLWLALPTALLAIALSRLSPALTRAERLALAFSAWLVLSGLLVWGTAHVLSPKGLPSLGIKIFLSFSAVFLVVWRYRRDRSLATSEANSLYFDIRDARNSVSVGATMLLCGLLFVAATAVSRSIAVSGQAPESYLYATLARAWTSDGSLDLARMSELSPHTVPIAGWSQIGMSLAAAQWRDWIAPVWHCALLIAGGLLLLTTMRTRGVTLATSALLLTLAFLSSGLAGQVQRNSDAWVIAFFSAIALTLWADPARRVLALLFSVLAFIWNPNLGWPLALSLSLVAVLHQRVQADRQRRLLWAVVLIFVFGLISVLLQGETFLPQTLRSRMGLNTREASFSWAFLSSGQWLSALVLAFGLILAPPTSRHGRELSSVPTVLLWVAFCLLAALLTPNPLSESAASLTTALIGAILPALILVVGASTWSAANQLSDYERDVAVAPTDEPTTSGASDGAEHTPASQAESTSNAPQSVREFQSIEEVRSRLMEGFNALGAGDLQTALSAANEILALDPQHPDAHHLVALVAVEDNRPGDALRAVLKALDVFPEHALFHLTVSDIYGKQSRFAEQAMALQEASRLSPADVSIKTRLLLAKRKALMAQASAQSKSFGSDAEHSAYQILVSRESNKSN
jgi:hypothetical protein